MMTNGQKLDTTALKQLVSDCMKDAYVEVFDRELAKGSQPSTAHFLACEACSELERSLQRMLIALE